jgi:hypothetical protein
VDDSDEGTSLGFKVGMMVLRVVEGTELYWELGDEPGLVDAVVDCLYENIQFWNGTWSSS